MAKSLLETGQDGLFVAGLDMDDPVGRQASLGQRRGEEVLAGDAPEHLAAGPCGNAGGEQRRGRAVDGAGAAAGDLVERAERQAAVRKVVVQDLQAEWQDPLGPPASILSIAARRASTARGAGAMGMDSKTGRR